ncbi:hypothetical protein JCM8547_005407 [Rhodosporidiobolus lusitaniae]
MARTAATKYTTTTVETSSTTIPSSLSMASTPGLRTSSRIRDPSVASSPASSVKGATPTPRKRGRPAEVPASSPAADSSAKKQRTHKGKDGEDLWPDELDEALRRGLALIPNIGKRTVYLSEESEESYGRNGLLSEYIRRQTGVVRNKVQCASHTAVWRKNNPDNTGLLALIKGHDVPSSSLSAIDWNSFLGPDNFPHTLSKARQSPARGSRFSSRHQNDSDDDESGAESSDLSELEDEDDSPKKSIKGKETARPRPQPQRSSSRLSLAPSSSTASTSAGPPPPAGRRNPRRSLAPTSSAADTTDEERAAVPKAKRQPRKSTLSAPSQGSRRSARTSLAPSSSAAEKEETDEAEDTPMEDAAPSSTADAAEEAVTAEIIPAPGQVDLALAKTATSDAEVHADEKEAAAEGEQREEQNEEPSGWFGSVKKGIWRALGY